MFIKTIFECPFYQSVSGVRLKRQSLTKKAQKQHFFGVRKNLTGHYWVIIDFLRPKTLI
jgi:hypothetical protein